MSVYQWTTPSTEKDNVLSDASTPQIILRDMGNRGTYNPGTRGSG